jgi:hypothetical protein
MQKAESGRKAQQKHRGLFVLARQVLFLRYHPEQQANAQALARKSLRARLEFSPTKSVKRWYNTKWLFGLAMLIIQDME